MPVNRPGMSGTLFLGKDGVMSGSTSKRYPVELRERAVRMVTEIWSDHEWEWAAMTQVSQLLGVGTPETVRR
jgi:transposase